MKKIFNKLSSAIENASNSNNYIFGKQYIYNNKSIFEYHVIKNRDNKIIKNNNYFEILNNSYSVEERFYKLYFDIESDDIEFIKDYILTGKSTELIDRFINIVISYYQKLIHDNDLLNIDINLILNNIVILESDNQDKKMSYHIIFNEITYKDIKKMKEAIKKITNSSIYYDTFKEINKKYKINYPDLVVYKSNQQMRLVNQSKIGKNNILRLVNQNLTINDTFITTSIKGNFHNNDIFMIEEIEKITLDNNYNILENDDIIIEDNDETYNLVDSIFKGYKQKRYDYKEWLKLAFNLKKMNKAKKYRNLFIEWSKLDNEKKRYNKKLFV